MADTIRSLSALQTLLADNAVGAISAQDVRDFLVTAVPSGRSASAVVAASGATDKQKYDADYVCDGTADESEINAALTAVGANGRVVLTDGQFNLGANIAISRDGQVLEGQGRWATKLFLSNGANDNMIVISGNGGTACRGPMIRGMNLDGNGDNQTDGLTVEARSGIYIFSTAAYGQVIEPVVQDVYVTKARGMGISCDGESGSEVLRPRFIDVIAIQNGYPGATGGGGAAFDGDGLHIGYADDVVLVGVNAQYNTDTGIAVDYSDVVHEVACVCRANTSNQFAFGNGTVNAYLFGPHADGLSIGNYGIRTGHFPDPGGAGTTDNIHIYGGKIANCLTAGIHLAHHGTMRLEATKFSGNAAKYTTGSSPGFLLARGCTGFTTEAGGTATILSGASSVVIAHGLDVTPAAKNVSFVITNGAATTGFGYLFVFSTDATNITIAAKAAVSANVTLAWSARVDV